MKKQLWHFVLYDKKHFFWKGIDDDRFAGLKQQEFIQVNVWLLPQHFRQAALDFSQGLKYFFGGIVAFKMY